MASSRGFDDFGTPYPIFHLQGIHGSFTVQQRSGMATFDLQELLSEYAHNIEWVDIGNVASLEEAGNEDIAKNEVAPDDEDTGDDEGASEDEEMTDEEADTDDENDSVFEDIGGGDENDSIGHFDSRAATPSLDRFTELPLEIRRIIWDLASLDISDIQPINNGAILKLSTHDSRGWRQLWGNPEFCSFKLPGVLHACTESRTMAQKLIDRNILISPRSTPSLSTLGHFRFGPDPRNFLFSPNTDFAYIDALHFHPEGLFGEFCGTLSANGRKFLDTIEVLEIRSWDWRWPTEPYDDWWEAGNDDEEDGLGYQRDYDFHDYFPFYHSFFVFVGLKKIKLVLEDDYYYFNENDQYVDIDDQGFANRVLDKLEVPQSFLNHHAFMFSGRVAPTIRIAGPDGRDRWT